MLGTQARHHPCSHAGSDTPCPQAHALGSIYATLLHEAARQHAHHLKPLRLYPVRVGLAQLHPRSLQGFCRSIPGLVEVLFGQACQLWNPLSHILPTRILCPGTRSERACCVVVWDRLEPCTVSQLGQPWLDWQSMRAATASQQWQNGELSACTGCAAAKQQPYAC